MSKIDGLIAELCPNGVIYKKLKLVAEYGRNRIDATVVNAHTYVGVDNLLPNKNGKKDSEYVPEEGRLIEFVKGDVLIGNIRPYLKKIWLAEYDGGTNGDVLVVHITEKELSSEFLYYCLSSDQFFDYDMQFSKGSKMPRGDKSAIMEYSIPVPPIAVQREIVQVLGNLTKLTAELIAKLTAELEKRKVQIDNEKNRVMSFNETVSYIPLSQYFPNIRNGFVGTVTKHFSDKEHGIRYLEGRNIHAGVISNDEEIYVSREFHNQHLRTELHVGDIVMVQSGHVGECAVVGPELAGANCHALIIMSNGGQCNSRFMMHYFQSFEGKSKLAKITTGETVKHILASAMQRFLVPVVSLDEQKRIVEILDSLGSSYDQLREKLLAEIEARQKQCEYYRDKLLSFKEA